MNNTLVSSLTELSDAKYTFFLVNFGWFSSRTASSLDEAKEVARSIGYETTIRHNGSVIGFWSPIGGWRNP